MGGQFVVFALDGAFVREVELPDPDQARSEAELGIFLTNVLNALGIELVGPFPADLQQELLFTSAIAADTKEADAAKALIDYLKTPAMTAAINLKKT